MFLAVSIWSTSPVLLRCRSSADGLVLLHMVYDFCKTLHLVLSLDFCYISERCVWELLRIPFVGGSLQGLEIALQFPFLTLPFRALRNMNPNLGKTVTPDLIVALSCKSDLELLWLIEGQGRKPRLTPSRIF